jgi:hypothetical protein
MFPSLTALLAELETFVDGVAADSLAEAVRQRIRLKIGKIQLAANALESRAAQDAKGKAQAEAELMAQAAQTDEKLRQLKGVVAGFDAMKDASGAVEKPVGKKGKAGAKRKGARLRVVK